MVRAGDAILQATDNFIKAKKESLELSIASKEATMAQDLAIEASKKLRDDFENSADGEFNATKQLEWYDSKVTELSSSIPSKDRRTEFQNLLKRNRGNFAISANELEFKDQIQVEKKNSDKRKTNFAVALQDPNANPDDLLINTLDANAYARQSASRSNRALYDTEDEQFAIQAVGEKVNRLSQAFATREITREDYEAGLANVDSILRQPGVLDHVDGQKITSMFGAIDELRTNSKVAAETNFVTNLLSDYEGELTRLEQGFEINEDFIGDLKATAAKYPENLQLQKAASTFEALTKHGNLFTSIRIGDTKSATKDVNEMRASLESIKDTKKFLATSKAISVLEAKIQVAQQLRVENTAEAFKNNPEFKQAKAKMLDSSDPNSKALYVSTLVRLDKEQGGNGKNIELFDKTMLQNYTTVLEGMSADQMEAQILSLQSEWGQDLGNNVKAWQSIVGQISSTGSPVTIAARFAGTPVFNKIYTMQKLSSESLKLVAGDKTTMTDLRDEVFASATGYVQTLLERNPDNPELVTRELEAILKTAQGAPLDQSSGVSAGFPTSDDRKKAVTWAMNLHVNQHMEIKNKGRVSVSISKDPEKNMMSKAILKTPTADLADMMLRETAKRAGVDVALRGDDSALVQQIAGVDYETFDYRSIKDQAKIIDSQDGDGFAVAVPVAVGTVPGAFTGKNGERVVAEFSVKDLYELVNEKQALRKRETTERLANLSKARFKNSKLDAVIEEADQQRVKTGNTLEQQLQIMEAKNAEIKKLLNGDLSD